MRRQSKGYEIDMCNGTLANKILLFALPLMASSSSCSMRRMWWW